MGKTSLCTDAAEPVAGGATADKYVSRQHHGGVAHRGSRSLSRYPQVPPVPHGIPRRVPRVAPPNSSWALLSFPRAQTLLTRLRFSHFSSLYSFLPLSYPSLTFSPFFRSRPFFPFFSLFPCPPASRIDGSLFHGRRRLCPSSAALRERIGPRAFILYI